MPSSLGPAEILVILVVALIVLGPTKLPQVGRQVGRALAEVRRWTQDVKNEVSTAFDPEPPRAPEVQPDPTLHSSYEVIPPASADYQPPEIVAEATPDNDASAEAPATVEPAAAEAAAPVSIEPEASAPGKAKPEAPPDDRN